MSSNRHRWCVAFVVAAVTAAPAAQQAPSPATAPRPPRPQPAVDPDRAQLLYVSSNPKDHSVRTDFQRDIEAKRKIDERYAEVIPGTGSGRSSTGTCAPMKIARS
jgi:hypothetical protein